MNPKELRYRQSQRYNAIMDRRPTRPIFDWICPNCGGSRDYPKQIKKDMNPVQTWSSGWWFYDLCDNHVPSKEDVVRHLLSRVR